MFRRDSRWHGPPFRPHMPFGPNMVKELSQLVFLWTITEAEEGITGYELQKNYNTKQTNVYRVLKEMETLEFLASEEKIIKGRAQRVYKITEKGKQYLVGLREKWTNRIAFLTDIVPPERLIPPMQHRAPHERKDFFARIKSKEELLTYVEHLERYFTRRQKSLESRLERAHEALQSIEEITQEVNNMEQYDPKEAEEILKKFITKKREKGRKK